MDFNIGSEIVQELMRRYRAFRAGRETLESVGYFVLPAKHTH